MTACTCLEVKTQAGGLTLKRIECLCKLLIAYLHYGRLFCHNIHAFIDEGLYLILDWKKLISYYSRCIREQNVPLDTTLHPVVTTAASLVVIHHMDLGVRVGVTVLRRTVTMSTDVTWQVSLDLAQYYIPILVKFLWVLVFGFTTVFCSVDRNNVKKYLLLALQVKAINTKLIIILFKWIGLILSY